MKSWVHERDLEDILSPEPHRDIITISPTLSQQNGRGGGEDMKWIFRIDAA